MKRRTLALALLALSAPLCFGVAAGQAQPPQGQTVYRTEAQETFAGSPEHFTGQVAVRMLFPPNETAQFSGAYVTFQPGARTDWHLHPAGQHLVVTSGVALTGTRDGTVIKAATGDAIWCPPGVDHWHGATPDAPMTHLALSGRLDGKSVVWKEKVSDEQYLAQ